MALQVWLPLNGNLNNQGLDNITMSGSPTFEAGKIGQAASFGTTAKSITSTSTIVLNSEVTVSFWIKITTWVNWGRIFHLYNSDGTAYISSVINTSDGIGTFVGKNGSSLNDSYSSGLTTGEWHHFAVVVNGTSKKHYLDGSVVGQWTMSGAMATENYYVKAGGVKDNTSPATCLMNDFRVYDHALSPKEIEILSRGLVCHYPLNGGGRGGDNLYIEPYWKYSTTKWGYAARVGTVKPVLNSDGSVTFTGGGGTNSQCYIHHISNRVAISSNTTYTVSCKITASGSGTFKIYLYQFNSSGTRVGNVMTTTHNFVDGETKTISNTITTTSTTASFYAELNMYGSPTTSTMLLHANSLKLEKGSTVTPWMPNSADTAYTAMGYDSTTEYDVSGYGYNGTKTGTFAYDTDTPRYSVCTKYSGSNYSYVTSPSSEIRTIAFWAKWDSIPSGQSILFVDGKSKTGFGLASRGIICSSNSITTYTFNKSNLVANTWYHFVIVCPNGGSDTSRKLYINGVEQTATSNQDYWVYSLDQLQIGKRSTSSDGFVGKMSDFRIYATALSAAQVAELYNTAVSVANNGTLMGYELVEN